MVKRQRVVVLKEKRADLLFFIRGTSLSQLGVMKAEAEKEKTLSHILSFIFSSFLCSLRI